MLPGLKEWIWARSLSVFLYLPLCALSVSLFTAVLSGMQIPWLKLNACKRRRETPGSHEALRDPSHFILTFRDQSSEARLDLGGHQQILSDHRRPGWDQSTVLCTSASI